jgi:hypothetical protein
MEYIGFLISLFALIYLFFKQQSLARHRQQHPETGHHHETLEDDSLTELIKGMNRQAEHKSTAKPAPPAPPKPTKPQRKGAASPLEQYRLESSVEKRQLKSSLESRQLKPTVRKHVEETSPRIISESLYHADHIPIEPSRAEVALRRLAHRRDLVIYQEIIDKPKSMRPFT